MATEKTTKTTSAKKTTTKTSNAKSTAPKEPSRKTDLTTSNQKYAQMINFAELQRILQQNISKGTSKTYTQYTKEKLQSYIKSPLANIDNLRDISAFLYRISHNYKKIIEYYSYTPLFSYNISYKTPDWSKPPKNSKNFLQGYQELCTRLENMNLKSMCPQIIATCLRDGIYCGFCYDDGNSFFISALDPKYCKISALSDKNTYILKFDASYFDVGNNKDFLYGTGSETDSDEGLWDDVFVEGYETYKDKGNDYKWFELPPERTISIICGDDPVVPLPYFLPVFVSLLDLLDYEALIRSKTELENYVLLVSKVPMNTNSGEVNDFAVDLEIVQATQSAIDEVLPSLVGSAWTPCEIEKIEFGNKNQVDDTNVYSQAIKNLFSSLGISEMIFNGEKSGSVGLKHSITVDMTLPLELLKRIDSNIQRYIRLNITEDFSFRFHQVSVFNKDEYLSQLKDQATLGIPVKMDYATAGGKSPLDVMNDGFMENALGLTNIWKPLSSSYTQSGKESGGQTKKDDELSDSAISTRDAGKNEGTKAGK